MFPTIGANTVIGDLTGATATPAAFATSSLFAGSTGQLGFFSGAGGLVGTPSIFVSTKSFIGISSTTPFRPLNWYRHRFSTDIPANGSFAPSATVRTNKVRYDRT
jgi:hypothetical protein